ncbi:hypothetical protein D3C81_2211600 [compost metagenome]
MGNIPFKQKLATYTHYFQQREITHFVSDGRVWGKDAIQARHEKIVAALITML